MQRSEGFLLSRRLTGSLLTAVSFSIIGLCTLIPNVGNAQTFSDQFNSLNTNTVWQKVDQGSLSCANGILSMKGCNLVAGDVTWQNYTMEFRAKAPTTASEVRIFASFRYNRDETRYVFGLRGGNNNDLYLARLGIDNKNAILKIVPLDFVPQKGVWYTVKIEVEGSIIRVFLNGETTPRLTTTDSGATFSSGKIGLGGGWADVDFDYVTVAPLQGYVPSASAIKYNFQPTNAATVSGWTKLDHTTASGWIDGGMFSRERNVSSDQLFDTLVGFSTVGTKRFSRAVANGDYVVSVHMGDPSYASQNKLYFMSETAPSINNTTSAGESALVRRSIKITNGVINLKFELSDTTSGSSINWLAIDPRASAGETAWNQYNVVPVDPYVAKEAQRQAERAAYTKAVVTNIGNSATVYSLNGKWLFLPDYQTVPNSTPYTVGFPDSTWHVIDVPNFWSPTYNWTYMADDQGKGSSNWAEKELARCEGYTFDYNRMNTAYYKHTVNLPSQIAGKTVKLHFESIAKNAQIWVNGSLAAVHQGMFAPITVDVTPWVAAGDNIIVVQAGDVKTFASSNTNIQGVAEAVALTDAELGKLPRGMFFGKNRGIWQDVSLIVSDPVTIEDTFFKPKTNSFDCVVKLKNRSTSSVSYKVAVQLRDRASNKLVYDHSVSNRTGTINTGAGAFYNGTLRDDPARHAAFKLWTPEFPNLYTADIFAYNYTPTGTVNLTSFSTNAIKLNFQSLNNPKVAGWTAVDGSVYNTTRKYGWSESVQTRDRNKSSDQLFDTLVSPNADSEAVFTYDIANGDYVITLQFGDPSYPTLAEAYVGDHVNTIDKVIVRDFQDKGKSLKVLKSLTVTNGKLQITIPRLPAAGTGTSVNWLTIEKKSDVSTAKWNLGLSHFNVLDNTSYNVGFRTFTVSGDNFLLNGYPYKIRGANHNPNIIRPNDKPLADWFMKKVHDSHINFTRAHANPMNTIWLNAADEQGVAVSQEGTSPWFMANGDPANMPSVGVRSIWLNEWKALINKHKNHPSVLMWTMNNEQKLYISNSLASWQVLSDAIGQVRAIDPTRPVVADSGYYRKTLEKKGGVQPGIDDGDVDDEHTYPNWYDENTFYALRDGSVFTDGRTAGRPYISQEFGTGYLDADTGHPVKHYLYTHFTSQSLVGKWGFEHYDPKYYMKRHALNSKESCEAIRTGCRDTSAGIMIFALCTWFQNLYDVNTINPYPTLEAVAKAWEPVMVSAQLMGRHFYAGSSQTVNSFIVNDSPIRETLSSISVNWEVNYSNSVLSSGTKSYSGTLGYYSNKSETLTFTLPATLPQSKIDAKLILKLNANGRAISTNSYDITVCNNAFVNNASGLRVGYFTQNDRLSAAFAKLGVTVVPVSNLGTLSTTDYDVLVVANLTSKPANYTNILNFANAGGKVLLSMNDTNVLSLFPAELRGSTLESREIVTPCAYERKVFSGIAPDDLCWFTGTETSSDSKKVGYTPIACTRAYNVNYLPNVTLLAETTRIHGYYTPPNSYHPSKTLDQIHGYPLLEIQKGSGRVIVSSMYVQATNDPIAVKLLANILEDLTGEANSKPVVTSSAPTAATVGAGYTYTINATDPDGDSLTYSASVKPSWLSFNTGTRALSGTPTTTNIGTHAVTLSVTDGKDTVNQQFSIVVSAASSGVSNLVQNGSFEIGGTAPASWVRGGSAVGSGASVQDGTNALRIATAGANASTTQTVPIQIGVTYDISVWINAAGVTSGKAIFDTSDKYDGTGQGQFTISSANSGWTKYSGRFVATNTAVTLRIFTDSTFNGTIYFDNVVIAPASVQLPSPWQTQDIGGVGKVGSAAYNSGTFTLIGGGRQIGGTSDALRYVHQVSSGDCDIMVKVVSLTNTAVNARSGVMIRETLNANARAAGVWVSPTNGIYFTYRTGTGSSATNVVSTGKKAPYWVRLTRTGSTFKAFYGTTGTNWTQLGANATISMTTNAYIGMGVCSGDTNKLSTNVISSVTATP